MTASLATVVDALHEAGQLRARPEQLPTISGITEDSRRVQPGWLFCAIVGSADDGHRHVVDAATRGAAAALVTRPVEAGLPQVIVADSRVATAIGAAEWFGRPGDRLQLVGVTGTNGKTTAVQLVRHLFNSSSSAGSVGTLGAFDGASHPLEGYGSLTTPGAVELQAVLSDLVKRGTRTVAIEASSHALDQHRLETLGLAGAVFTNLTHDHLDYHQDVDAYRAAKARLLDLVRDGAVVAVNADDPAWADLSMPAGVRRVAFGGTPGAEVRAGTTDIRSSGTTVRVTFGDQPVELSLPLIGAFNVSNAMAAAAVAWGLGMSPADIAARLATAPQVPGRMERLGSADQPFVILRDYAHTPDALERAIDALKPITTGRLIVLFGAGGDRDRYKRPLMGAIAARGADVAIVTSDNPRTEDPATIVREIEAGMGNVEHIAIVDREEAIGCAVDMLRSGDSLLLAGKGHETYQVVGTDKRPFDERVMVSAALASKSAA